MCNCLPLHLLIVPPLKNLRTWLTDYISHNVIRFFFDTIDAVYDNCILLCFFFIVAVVCWVRLIEV